MNRCGGIRLATRNLPTRSEFGTWLWERRMGAGYTMRGGARALNWPMLRVNDLEWGKAEPTEAERRTLETLLGNVAP